MPTPRVVTGLLLAALVSSGCEVNRTPRAEVVDADSAAREDIRATLNRYQDALLAGDARTAATFFASDGRLMQPGARDLVGAREVHDSLSAFFGGTRITAISLDRSSIDIGPPGIAHEIGTFIESARVGDDLERTVRGRYVIRWQAGPESTWRINAFLTNHHPPDATAEASADSPGTAPDADSPR